MSNGAHELPPDVAAMRIAVANKVTSWLQRNVLEEANSLAAAAGACITFAAIAMRACGWDKAEFLDTVEKMWNNVERETQRAQG